MSAPMIVDQPRGKFKEVVDKVCRTNKPVTVKTKGGKAVKVIPVPTPIGYRKGVPVYRAEDIQYLYLDHPYWFAKWIG
ncbi:MAG: hypothetical protein NTW87_16825 [Planctomycetota bacterium]|nr:hypothetical protein [Planctomycetota bacterium]